MKKVIFTADDYGAIPEIDEGIREAVRAGRINSVAVFANGRDDHWQDSIAQLIEAGDEARIAAPPGTRHTLEIGLHLTLTSGWPIVGHDALREQRRRRCDRGDEGACQFHHVNDFNFGVERDIVYEELQAQYCKLATTLSALQVDRPHDAPRYEIMHLSSHYNILNLNLNQFEAFVDLARITATPIRSPIVVPEERFIALLVKIFVHTFGNTDRAVRSQCIRNLKKARDFFTQHRNTLVVPDSLDVSHYWPVISLGPLPLFRRRKVNVWRGKLTERLAADSGEKTREFVFHIIGNDSAAFRRRKAKRWATKYPGVAWKRFDSRLIEMRSLMGLTDEHLKEAGVEFGSWKELDRGPNVAPPGRPCDT